MKKYYMILIIMILMIFLTSCSTNKFDIKDRIVSPENNIPPLQGKWIVEKSIDSPNMKAVDEESDTMVGKEVLFHKDAVVVGGNYAIEPSYKLKNVNFSDYILYKFKIDPEQLGVENEESQIVTILSNNQYFYEFIKINDEEMIVYDDDRFYFLKKNIEQISKEEVDRYINVENKMMRTSNVEEVDTLRTGILLGIKSNYYDESTQLDNWEYKTVWIRFNNRSIASAYDINDLLVPRKKGFWLVDVNREEFNGSWKDHIRAVQKGQIKEEIMEGSTFSLLGDFGRMLPSNVNPSILKNILYIGNDYVSAEVINSSNNERNLKVYPIDYLEEEKGISISDIIGENGLKIFKEGAQNLTKVSSNILLDEESFGLARRNGYWIVKGRINYMNNDEQLYKDYNIKVIPPKELVNYDELSIPWSIIKSKVPEAVDAFTSPNEDIIIIVTRKNLQIYSISNNEISNQEIGRIKLSSLDSVVMAEWATSKYTILWEEEVLKNQGQVVKY